MPTLPCWEGYCDKFQLLIGYKSTLSKSLFNHKTSYKEPHFKFRKNCHTKHWTVTFESPMLIVVVLLGQSRNWVMLKGFPTLYARNPFKFSYRLLCLFLHKQGWFSLFLSLHATYFVLDFGYFMSSSVIGNLFIHHFFFHHFFHLFCFHHIVLCNDRTWFIGIVCVATGHIKL